MLIRSSSIDSPSPSCSTVFGALRSFRSARHDTIYSHRLLNDNHIFQFAKPSTVRHSDQLPLRNAHCGAVWHKLTRAICPYSSLQYDYCDCYVFCINWNIMRLPFDYDYMNCASARIFGVNPFGFQLAHTHTHIQLKFTNNVAVTIQLKRAIVAAHTSSSVRPRWYCQLRILWFVINWHANAQANSPVICGIWLAAVAAAALNCETSNEYQQNCISTYNRTVCPLQAIKPMLIR